MVLPFEWEKGVDSTTSGSIPRSLALLLVVLSGLGSGSIGSARQFSSGVNLVEVYAAVLDHNGMPVTGLKRDDFTVLEDAQPQALSAFAEGDFPLSVALAIDRSFSLAKQLPTEVSAARTFLGELRPQDQSMIVAIGSEIETLAPLSNDRQAQFRALSTLTPWGSTGLYDAIIQAIDSIQAAKGRRALVLLSDGDDRYSKATAGAALDRARRSDVMVYPIATGRTRPPLFAELASLTGGRSFQPRDPGDLNATMRSIANELRHQYLLGYTPSRPIVAGQEQWRSITVRVNRPDLTVRARDGYTAK
jgi:Ca-activated chloride channel family protein